MRARACLLFSFCLERVESLLLLLLLRKRKRKRGTLLVNELAML